MNYNTRAAKALRFLAHTTGDEHVTALLHEWSRSWVDAAHRTDKGKPAGIPPASIRFPDEVFNGDEPTWYAPEMYWPYFRWAHDAGSQMLDQLFHTYVLTADEALLAPLFASLDLVRTYGEGDHEEGSPGWAAGHLRASSDFWDVVEAWRLHTGDDRYDALILRHGTPYARFRITGDRSYLTKGLEPLLETLRHNVPLRTTEVLHTDRVYLPGDGHLESMVTGGSIENSPYAVVSWSDTDSLFTALVVDSGPRNLTAEVFGHGRQTRTIHMHIHGLEPGTYALEMRPDDGRIETSQVTLSGRGTKIPLLLPPQRLVTIVLKPVVDRRR